jgi:hypothetical protein
MIRLTISIGIQRLWHLTPKTHTDYLPSLSLYYSIRMIVHVMHEVKLREEEYEFVKGFSAHIKGILPSVQLARRERRLLWHGELACTRFESASTTNRQGSRSNGFNGINLGSSTTCGSHRTPTIVLSPCCDSLADGNGKQSGSKGKAKATQSSVLQVSIFTDLLLLTERMPNAAGSSQTQLYELASEVGISKVTDVVLQGTSGAFLSALIHSYRLIFMYRGLQNTKQQALP